MSARPAALLPLLLLLAATATAAAAEPAAEAYPFTVALVVDPASPAARYLHQGPVGSTAPPVTVDLVDQARLAYAAAAARLFQGVGGADPALRLEVRVVRAAVDDRMGSRTASVTHQVVALAADGRELDRWSVTGAGATPLREGEALVGAFARAAREAVLAFRADLEASPALAAWLADRGVGVRLSAAPQVAEVPRAPWSWHVDGGVGVARGMDLGLRVGLSSRWGYLAASVDRWATLVDSPYRLGINFPANLETWLVGLEAGAAYRPANALEVRAGAGAHWLQMNVDQPIITGAYYEVSHLRVQRAGLAGTLGGAVTYTFPLQSGRAGRARVGLEARRLLGSRLTFEQLGGQFSAGSATVLLLVGYELPLGAGAGPEALAER